MKGKLVAKKKKNKKKIRSLALCVFRRDDKLFISEGYDALKDQIFYRPIGGGIDFSERGHDTIKREVMEEIHAEVEDIVYLGTLENIFNYEGKDGHEICLIYDGRFVDSTINTDDYTVTAEEKGEILYTASWKPLAFFEDEMVHLYPEGLLDLLKNQG